MLCSCVQTNLPIFKLKESSVKRRYSDFEWLKSELERDSKVSVQQRWWLVGLSRLQFQSMLIKMCVQQKPFGWCLIFYHACVDHWTLSDCSTSPAGQSPEETAALPPRRRPLWGVFHRGAAIWPGALHQQVRGHPPSALLHLFSVLRLDVRWHFFFYKKPNKSAESSQTPVPPSPPPPLCFTSAELQVTLWPRTSAVFTCSCRRKPSTATTFPEKYDTRVVEGGGGETLGCRLDCLAFLLPPFFLSFYLISICLSLSLFLQCCEQILSSSQIFFLVFC